MNRLIPLEQVPLDETVPPETTVNCFGKVVLPTAPRTRMLPSANRIPLAG